MDKITGGRCHSCEQTGHISIDCPKNKGGNPVKVGRSTGSSIKLRVTNDAAAAGPPPLIPIRSKSEGYGFRSDRLQDKIRRTASSNLPKTQIKMKRLRGDYLSDYSDSEEENRFEIPSDMEEPLTIQVEFSKLRKSKQKSKHLEYRTSSRDSSDLRSQLKTKAKVELPAPIYKTSEDLRFTMRRSSSESKRKKTKPPEYDIPDYPETEEEEEEVLAEGGEIKQAGSGTVFKFDTSEDETKPELPIPTKRQHRKCESKSEAEVPVEMKEEIKSEEEEEAEVASSKEDSSSASSESEGKEEEDSSDSSSSSSSSAESESEKETEEMKKKFIDIRDKYDSKPISATPLSSRLSNKSSESRSNGGSAKNGVSAKHSKVEEIKREHPTTDESDENSPKKKPKRPKVTGHKNSSRNVDMPLSREELLSKQAEDRDYESFSDDGEDDKEHGGALNGLQDTPPPAPRKSPKRPKPEKIVPIFPFKTKCKPGQFPESKVPFLDSHCHIDYLFVREQNFGTFASYVESKDFPKNFSGCVANFCDPPAWTENQMYEEILEEDGVWGAFGLHPHNASQWSKEIERNLIKACSHPKCVAWGEMGLDYGNKNHDLNPDVIEAQKDAFMAQITHALRLKKPLVIHARGAEFDAFEILKEKVPKDHCIHFHCYTGMWSVARQMLEYFPNLFLGITGLVTYGTASDVREVTRKTPLDRLLIETDAPYMKPFNARDVDLDSPRTASPAMGIWVAHKIAELRKVDLDDVLKQVRINVRNMYGI